MSKLAILNFGLRYLARPFMATTKTPERAKRDFDRAAKYVFRTPVAYQMASENVAAPGGDLPLFEVTCGSPRNDTAVLYFHGGGYVAGSPKTHKGMLAQLSKLAQMPVFAPNYRLAQTAPFPAAFDDAVTAWDALRAKGYAPSQIIIGGDSAGGGLVFALLAHLLNSGVRPAGAFAYSPWTDLTLTGASLSENEKADAILPRRRIGELVSVVMGEADPADPRISPLLADWKTPPPTYIQASRTEILRDDAVRMAEVLRAAGGDVTLDLWDDAPHVWQIFDGWLPEARDALARTSEFCNRCLTNSLPESES